MATFLEAPNDRIMQEDLEQLANSNLPIDMLKDSTIFVTGATGLIGSQLIKALLCMNRVKDTNIKILAFVRSEAKAKAVFGELLELPALQLVIGDISAPIVVAEEIDYIIHGASPTSSKYFVTNPVETIKTALDGTTSVLELAKSKAVKGVVYLSSLEVYGTPAQGSGLIGEKDYGYIDPMSVRSSYSEGKRIVECLCVSYAKEYNVPVKVARLSQTFGAGVEYEDGRVFAEFNRCATEKRDIVLHTMGNTVRSYCYTKDAISAILYILLKGECAEAYNVTNMDTAMSIKEMAELVCEINPDAGISVKIEIPENVASFGYNPEMIIRLDSTRLMELGWQPTVDLAGMFTRMKESISDRRRS